MGNLILSGFADECATPFEDQLKAFNRYGIKYIELRHADKKNVSELTAEEVREIKHKLDAYGISVSAIGSPLGKIKLDGDLDGHMETAKRIFETANVLGSKYIRFFSFYAPDGKDITAMKHEVFEALGRLVKVAKESGVLLCHENEAKIYGDIPERCLEILQAFCGDIKCVFDMGNFTLEGVEPIAAYELLKPHIEYFHIKDGCKNGAIVPPGKGDSAIAEILTRHKKYAENDFFTSLEPHLTVFSGLDSLVVERKFTNPYTYPDSASAFDDAVAKFKEVAPL
ncbi:MAG: sugar phosphate isomerase/epimerase [Clostridia bacterium]|nr:sugar phosphate isomerase/epimerase [Clostridia bacterium]